MQSSHFPTFMNSYKLTRQNQNIKKYEKRGKFETNYTITHKSSYLNKITHLFFKLEKILNCKTKCQSFDKANNAKNSKRKKNPKKNNLQKMIISKKSFE